MQILPYDRRRAVEYARKWAYSRNPLFYDFKGIGGDCTNFISQCLLAGSCVMNETPTYGWYYHGLNNRAPAWTGVVYLHNFLLRNTGEGPFGAAAPVEKLELGDVIQLGRSNGTFYHTLLVTGQDHRGILVAAHSDDAFNRPLHSYHFHRARGIHIHGVRSNGKCECYEDLLRGTSLFPCL